jgi:hypothetical protein
MRSRRLRKLVRIITAVGLGAILSALGAATALADYGPGPWP